jgi:hypothetical protein
VIVRQEKGFIKVLPDMFKWYLKNAKARVQRHGNAVNYVNAKGEVVAQVWNKVLYVKN